MVEADKNVAFAAADPPKEKEKKEVEPEKERRVLKPKAYKHKLKKFHEDSVLCLFSPDGTEGAEIMSGGSDHSIRVWKLKRKKLATSIDVPHPTEDELYQFKELVGKAKNHAPIHPINTTKELAAVSDQKKVTCYCFSKRPEDAEPKIICGYADGLICYWEEGEDEKHQPTPFIGHTNKVNHIMHIPDTQYIISVSNDCTMR